MTPTRAGRPDHGPTPPAAGLAPLTPVRATVAVARSDSPVGSDRPAAGSLWFWGRRHPVPRSNESPVRKYVGATGRCPSPTRLIPTGPIRDHAPVSPSPSSPETEGRGAPRGARGRTTSGANRTRLVVAALLLPLLLAADAPALAYTPPPPPAAADPLGLLLRLVGLTAAALAVCGGLVWLVRKAGRPAATDPGAAGRLVLESSLALDRKCSLHILKVDGQTVAATTDATGLRSLVLLAEPFDDHLDPAAGPVH
jgi:hypothetical protein